MGNFIFENYIVQSSNKFVILNKDMPDHISILNEFKIPQASGYGDIICNTGGIIVNNTVRIFGANKTKRNLSTWNKKAKINWLENSFIFADDIFGGQFAMSPNSNFNLENPIYFAPDALEWEEMKVNFLLWLLKGDLDEFYNFYYSKTADIQLAEIDFDKAINFFPPPFTKEFQEETPSKRIISAEELYSLHMDSASQL